MQRSLIAIALVALCAASASAQTMPPAGYHFVGSTAELLAVRAAFNHLFSDQSLAHGSAGLPAAAWTSPHDEAVDGHFVMPPYGLGEVDCMRAYYGGPEQAWNDGTGMYMNTATVVDGVAVTTPAVADLVAPDDLPQVCKDLVLATWCWWPELQCPTEPYCC